MAQHDKIYLNPTPVRIWHWLNALGIITLTVTGIQIRWPEFLNIFGTYKAAVSLHNTAGIVVSISYILWIIYYIFVSGSLLKIYVPTADDLKYGLFRQAIFYFFFYFFGRFTGVACSSPGTCPVCWPTINKSFVEPGA